MLLRILASVILLISIVYLPFWVSAILAFAGMIYFAFYFEAVGLFLISDLLYGAPEERYYGMVFVTMIFALVLLGIIEFAKKKIRFYPDDNQ
ncbi:MAG TPA: hypothetical protein VFQ59_02635 [Candidatus Paceibacterota bacterium]|nr:hypothetical protein [Candidatus Paceibacterota bacterium]